jgi:hypothetical protein
MPKPAVELVSPPPEEVDALLRLVSRLAAIHRDMSAEMRFCESVSLEGTRALLSVARLPLESAIVELGRLARGASPSVTARA